MNKNFDKIISLQPTLQRVAEQMVHDADLASDAVQETVIQLWKQREEWGKTINPEAYSVTLLKRRCVDQLRRQHPTSPIDEEALMMVEDVDDNLEERYQQARQLVDKLPDRQRDVILMKYEQGLDNKEIEKTLRMSSTHVYATLSRAYKNLREAFDRDRHCP